MVITKALGGGQRAGGGRWTWRPLPREPLIPVPEGIRVGLLDLCSDPRGVWFGTSHFHVALQLWGTLGLCRHWQQGKGVHFALEWTFVVVPPRPVYNPAAQYQYEGSLSGTPNTGTEFTEAAVLAAALPSLPADMGDPAEAGTDSTHFPTAMAAVQAQEALTGFEVCVRFFLLIFGQFSLIFVP